MRVEREAPQHLSIALLPTTTEAAQNNSILALLNFNRNPTLCHHRARHFYYITVSNWLNIIRQHTDRLTDYPKWLLACFLLLSDLIRLYCFGKTARVTNLRQMRFENVSNCFNSLFIALSGQRGQRKQKCFSNNWFDLTILFNYRLPSSTRNISQCQSWLLAWRPATNKSPATLIESVS